jgi:hypothetical protein
MRQKLPALVLNRELNALVYLDISSEKKGLHLCVGTWGDFAEPIHALKDYGDREPAGQIPLPKVVMAIQKPVISNSVLGQKIRLAIVLNI